MTFCRELHTYVLPFLLLLGACSFKSTEPQSETQSGNASFALGTITPLTSYSASSDPNWGVPTSRAFELRAKVLDSATSAPRIGENFLLWRDSNSELLSVDSEGWIKWTEIIPFLSLAPERLIPITRRISGKLGTQTIRFAINPWSDTVDFIDLTNQRDFKSESLVPDAESAVALRGQKQYRPEKHTPESGSNLIVEKVDLNIGQPKSNRARWLEVGFQVYAVRQKRDQGFTKVSLPSGNFRLTLKFLEQDDKLNVQRQWAGIAGTEVAVNHGKIVLQSELPITEIPEQSAQLKLHYFLEPVDPTVGLLPAQGELLMTSPSGRMSGAPLEQPLHYEMSISLEPRMTEAKSFLAQRWSANFSGEQSYNSETWGVRDYVDVEVCIVDPLSRLPIVNRPFQVSLSESRDGIGATFIETFSDIDGCLDWTGTLDFSKGHGERELDRFLLVRGVKSPYHNDMVAISVSFNPWQRGDLYYRNAERRGKSPMLKVDRRPILSSEGFSYTYENPTFETNSHLQLFTHHQYLATMPVALFRPANTAGKQPPELLREHTRLRVRGLIMHPLFVDKSRRGHSVERPVLAGFDVLGTVDDHSKISFVMNLPTEFTQGALVDARTKVLIEISTATGAEDLPASAIYSGPFKAVPGQSDLGETPLSPTEFTSDQFSQLWDNGAKSGKEYTYASLNETGRSFSSFTVWKKSPLELFVHYWKGHGPLEVVGLGSDLPKGWISEAEFASRYATNGSLLKRFKNGEPTDGVALDAFLGRFCTIFGKIEATQCLLSPQNYFHISAMQIVESVPEVRLRAPSVSTPVLQTTTSYFREYMFSQRLNNGRRQVREHAEAKTTSMGAALFNNGFAYTRSYISQDEFYDAEEASVQTDLRSRLQMQEQINLSSEGKRFEFEAWTRRCLMVRPTAVIATVFAITKAHLFCGDPTLTSVNESWYYVWDQWRQLSSSHVDSRDPWQRERGWMKLIRGINEYEYFKANLSDGVRFFVFKKIEPLYSGVDGLVETAFQNNRGVRFQEDGGIFPGVTHYRELSPFKWTEPQIEHYVGLCAKKTEPDSDTPLEKELQLWKFTRRYCRCYYENAAKLVQHGEYTSRLKEIGERMVKLGIPITCKKYGGAT